MAAMVWRAGQDVVDLADAVKQAHHLPRLDAAEIVVAFSDAKPFVKNRLNLGSVRKFSSSQKIWLAKECTFCITLIADVWHKILQDQNCRKAWIDLHLTRCEPVYIPETVEENGKKKVVKDDWGRVQYTTEIKLDDDGNPKWQIVGLDVGVFTQNVKRFGLWYEDLQEFGKVVK